MLDLDRESLKGCATVKCNESAHRTMTKVNLKHGIWS